MTLSESELASMVTARRVLFGLAVILLVMALVCGIASANFDFLRPPPAYAVAPEVNEEMLRRTLRDGLQAAFVWGVWILRAGAITAFITGALVGPGRQGRRGSGQSRAAES